MFGIIRGRPPASVLRPSMRGRVFPVQAGTVGRPPPREFPGSKPNTPESSNTFPRTSRSIESMIQGASRTQQTTLVFGNSSDSTGRLADQTRFVSKISFSF